MTELEELRLAYAECSRQRNELLTAHKLRARAAPQPEPDAWRIFDGEGGYDYKDEAPEPLDVEWAARYKRKYEPLYLHPPQPPPGYVLVPIEPTPEMLAAGVAAESNAATHVQERLTLYAYRAMIAAAQETKP